MKSRSRSLGLETYFQNVSVSRKSGKVSVSVSVSSRTENRRSRSHLGLWPQHLVLQAHFQREKFTNLTATLSVGLYSTACRSRNLCFYAIDSLSSCIIKPLC